MTVNILALLHFEIEMEKAYKQLKGLASTSYIIILLRI